MGKKDRKAEAAHDEWKPKTMLEAAQDAIERGDVVLARRAARKVLAANTHDTTTLAAAQRISKLYTVEGALVLQDGDPVGTLAHRIAARAGVPRWPFLFSAISFGVFLFLLALIRFRT